MSVIMPVFETPDPMLRRAVLSVLDQRCDVPLELVICDDGSSSDTHAFLNRLVASRAACSIPVSYVVHGRRRGPAAARNTAADVAQGRYLLWLDSDDELTPGAVRRLVDQMIGTTASMVIGRCAVEAAGSKARRDPGVYFDLARVYHGSEYDPLAQVVFSLQAQMVEAEAFRSVGGFDSDFVWAEFTELFLRFVRLQGLARVLDVPLEGYRYLRRPGSMSTYRKELERDRLKALRAYARSHVKLGGADLEVGYLGRSPRTGAQHYRLMTSAGCLIPPYDHVFFPADSGRPTPDGVAVADPAFSARASDRSWTRAGPGLAAVAGEEWVRAARDAAAAPGEPLPAARQEGLAALKPLRAALDELPPGLQWLAAEGQEETLALHAPAAYGAAS